MILAKNPHNLKHRSCFYL